MERRSFYVQLGKDSDPVEVAKTFLSGSYVDKNGYRIKGYKGEIYVYVGTHYKILSRASLQTDIIMFLQEQKELRSKATASNSNNIVLNVAALTKMSDMLEAPCFVKEKTNSKIQLISLKNGILDLNKFMLGKPPLLPHTSDFFCLNSLPFEYNPKANCPVWKSFINEILPDKELQNLIQEWFGYCMTHDTSHQKFLLLYGSGGDGKSVICKVLSELLGKDNISSVSLEQFCPSRTFPLRAMAGKLANIVGEIEEVKKVSEGVLKNIVAGGDMTVERKGRDPELINFTSKLIFATNTVPRFRDRSEGLWRRIFFIPFLVQTLDPKKQNRNYVDGSWWINSGELQGIMNWALEGLVRLTNRGYFIEPQASLDMKAEYKAEANPASTFLLENYEVTAGGNLCSSELYLAYSRNIKDQGGTPLGKGMFTREVKNTFRQAKLSKNPRAVREHRQRSLGPSRTRVWENLRVKK